MEITTLNQKGWQCNRISKDEMKDDDVDLTVKEIWEEKKATTTTKLLALI